MKVLPGKTVVKDGISIHIPHNVSARTKAKVLDAINGDTFSQCLKDTLVVAMKSDMEEQVQPQLQMPLMPFVNVSTGFAPVTLTGFQVTAFHPFSFAHNGLGSYPSCPNPGMIPFPVMFPSACMPALGKGQPIESGSAPKPTDEVMYCPNPGMIPYPVMYPSACMPAPEKGQPNKSGSSPAPGEEVALQRAVTTNVVATAEDKVFVVHSTHHLLGTKASEGNHVEVGCGTYAEMTKQSMTKVHQMLKNKNVLTPNDTVIDLGSGTGCFIYSLCQEFMCRGIGCEWEPIRQRNAYAYSLQLVRKCEEKSPGVLNTNVYLSWDDIQSLKAFPPGVKLSYQFDQEFPSSLANYLFDLYRLSGPEYVLSMNSYDKQRWLYSGYEIIDQVTITKAKTKSCRGNTCYLYRRMAEKDAEVIRQRSNCDGIVELVPRDPILNRRKDLFTRAEEYFEKDVPAKLQCLEESYQEIVDCCNAKMAKRKLTKGKGDKSRSLCLAEAWMKCDAMCEQCAVRFADHSSDLEIRESRIHDEGVFATRDISADTHLMEYTGKRVGRDVFGDDVMQSVRGIRVKPTSGSLHRYINHSPNPNAEFQKWVDASGEHHVSIVTTKEIKKDGEIVVYYGPDKGFSPKRILALLMARKDSLHFGHKRSYQLNRDTLRCETTERMFGVIVDTMDKRTCDEDLFSQTRHTMCDLNSTKTEFPEVCYDEMFMDWYWFNSTYLRDNLTDTFYSWTLPRLVEMLRPRGAMYVPLSASTFARVFHATTHHQIQLNMELMSEKDMEKISLFAGTLAVQHHTEIMAKEPYQHRKLGLTVSSLKGECDAEASRDSSFDKASTLQHWKTLNEEFSGKAVFIKLTKRQGPVANGENKRQQKSQAANGKKRRRLRR